LHKLPSKKAKFKVHINQALGAAIGFVAMVVMGSSVWRAAARIL
jgi:hypothetical protein